MDFWIKNLLWVIGCAGGLLATYMAYAHQLIRWQRKRGLLARQSHGLYWTILSFFNTYRWIVAVIILFISGFGIVALGVSRSKQASSADTTIIPKQPQPTAGDANNFSEIKNWIRQLESRRLEYPQEYCARVDRGISAFAQVQQPASIISLKLRHLKSEYQKHCPSTSSK